MLGSQFPEVASTLEGAAADPLAFCDFPQPHWRNACSILLPSPPGREDAGEAGGDSTGACVLARQTQCPPGPSRAGGRRLIKAWLPTHWCTSAGRIFPRTRKETETDEHCRWHGRAQRHDRCCCARRAGRAQAVASFDNTDQGHEKLLGWVEELGDVERLGKALVAATGTSLTEICGSALVAARILGEVGDVRRFPTKASFASTNGTAPISASSGRTERHRLNRGGNRRLNRALYIVALTQTRHDPRAVAYLAPATSGGKDRSRRPTCPQAASV